MVPTTLCPWSYFLIRYFRAILAGGRTAPRFPVLLHWVGIARGECAPLSSVVGDRSGGAGRLRPREHRLTWRAQLRPVRFQAYDDLVHVRDIRTTQSESVRCASFSLRLGYLGSIDGCRASGERERDNGRTGRNRILGFRKMNLHGEIPPWLQSPAKRLSFAERGLNLPCLVTLSGRTGKVCDPGRSLCLGRVAQLGVIALIDQDGAAVAPR